MINLTQSFGGIPVFWIRYNPDSFHHSNGSPASISQKRRQQHLCEWVRFVATRKAQELGAVIYLFYDGCDTSSDEKDIQTLISHENEYKVSV